MRNFFSLLILANVLMFAMSSTAGAFSWSMFLPAIHSGGNPTVETVESAAGRIWMDRNLGASRAATSPDDSAAYGYLYQWGRSADGHEKRSSVTTTTKSTTDTPGHDHFIVTPVYPYDWRTPQNNNLWQGIEGVNNPCPKGFRLPTQKEWSIERASWSSNDASGAFASPLKLVMGGYRPASGGSPTNVGSAGWYWSSTIYQDNNAPYSIFLLFNSSSAASEYAAGRSYGSSVRCIKN